jgi:hypothetical protein
MSMGATLRSSRSSSHQKFAPAEEIDPYHEGRHDEEIRDAPPRRRWRRRLSVLTLIAVGTYAYRTYYVEPASTQTPPGNTAEETPSKVIPAISDRQSGKLVQERVGARGSGERMVSREEQLVEPKSTDSMPRWAWALPPAPSGLPPQGTASAPDTMSSDPKRITTLAIRPDGTEASGGRVANPPPGTSASAAPSQPRLAQPAARGAPLSLDPQAPASDAAPAPPTQRALTPPAPRMAATPPPAVAANAAAGGYVVQVSSQRSEADAQASFRSLQEKFPSQLGGRTVIVRRADLGAKGIYYRVVTGPFASAGEADQFCGSLKAAGGKCIVQRN